MAPSPFGEAFTYTYNFPTTDGLGGYDPFFNDGAVRAVTTGYLIAIGELHQFQKKDYDSVPDSCFGHGPHSGLILGLQFIALIIVAIVYFKRQKRRKVRSCLLAHLAQALKMTDTGLVWTNGRTLSQRWSSTMGRRRWWLGQSSDSSEQLFPIRWWSAAGSPNSARL